MRADTVADDFQVRVSGHYASDGEHWSVDVIFDENVIASAHRLASSADARTAGEFLMFGARERWRVLAPPSVSAITSAIPAVEVAVREERPDQPDYDGFDEPERILRLVYGAIRRAQVDEFLRPETPRGPEYSDGRTQQWKLQTFKPYEPERSASTSDTDRPRHTNGPRTVLPNARYVILELDDAKALALNASADIDAQVQRVIDRIKTETGADIEDIIGQLKGIDTCTACAIEGQERSCVCWHANKLGRRLARLIDRANVGATTGQPDEETP